MSTIVELMIPYLKLVHPQGTEYSGDGETLLIVTLPKLRGHQHGKTQRLIFDDMVVNAIRSAEANGDKEFIDRVGNNVCNKLAAIFAKWKENNEQIAEFHVGDWAMDR